LTFDVDYLRDLSGVFLAMAEIEIPIDWSTPVNLPEFLRPFCILGVSEEDTTKFSNYKLCDTQYARKLLKKIL
jgi:hypothetical protein